MGEIDVRSYRAVFALERRIYRIDSIRLNPGGVPLRGIAYAAVAAALSLVAAAVPPVSWLCTAVPWYLRDVAFPIGLGALLPAVKVEGRVFHSALAALLRYSLGARRLTGLHVAPRSRDRLRPASIVFIVDGSEAHPRRLRYRGPGVALIGYPHDRVEWQSSVIPGRRRRLAIHPLDGVRVATRVAVELAPGAVLDVSTSALTRRPSRKT
jgi:hypothetical protein